LQSCFVVTVASSSFFLYWYGVINDANRISRWFLIADLKSRSKESISPNYRRAEHWTRYVGSRTSSFSLNYNFHSGAQEKEIHAGPRSSYPCGVTLRRSGSTTFPARASMSLFAKHLLAAIVRLLNSLACRGYLWTFHMCQ